MENIRRKQVSPNIMKKLVTVGASTTAVFLSFATPGYATYKLGYLSDVLNSFKGFGLNPMATLSISASIIFTIALLLVCLYVFRDKIFFKQTSADKGDSLSHFEIAERYRLGDGVKQNNDLATKHYKLAAKKGHCKAQYNLSEYYQDKIAKNPSVTLVGLFREERDQKRSFKYLKLSADQGYQIAQFRLGECFAYEYTAMYYGVHQDNKKSFDYYKLAANQKYAPAQYKVGECYSMGRGTECNERLAWEYYKLSSDQGYLPAQKMFENLNSPALLGLKKILENSSISRKRKELLAFRSTVLPVN